VTFIRYIEVYFTLAFLDCVPAKISFNQGSLYRGLRYIEVC